MFWPPGVLFEAVQVFCYRQIESDKSSDAKCQLSGRGCSENKSYEVEHWMWAWVWQNVKLNIFQVSWKYPNLIHSEASQKNMILYILAYHICMFVCLSVCLRVSRVYGVQRINFIWFDVYQSWHARFFARWNGRAHSHHASTHVQSLSLPPPSLSLIATFTRLTIDAAHIVRLASAPLLFVCSFLSAPLVDIVVAVLAVEQILSSNHCFLPPASNDEETVRFSLLVDFI